MARILPQRPSAKQWGNEKQREERASGSEKIHGNLPDLWPTRLPAIHLNVGTNTGPHDQPCATLRYKTRIVTYIIPAHIWDTLWTPGYCSKSRGADKELRDEQDRQDRTTTTGARGRDRA